MQTEFDLDMPKGQKKPNKKRTQKKPATEIMKIVASKTENYEDMKRVFTDAEIKSIMQRRAVGESVDSAESAALKAKYREIKRWVLEAEKGNQSRVIVFPCITNGTGWYKVVEFSALYYAYRLADRMGRRARVMNDSDKFMKAYYTASITNIDKFVEQFLNLEPGVTYEVTQDGVYIFTLKHPLTEDEVGMLRRTESTRREKLNAVIKPKAMNPAVYQAIMMVIRQVLPKVCKLDKRYYFAVGEKMAGDIMELLSTYFDFAHGVAPKEEAGKRLLHLTNNINAGLAIMSETRVWGYDVSANVGENVNNIKRLVIKDFKMRDATE